MKVLRKIIFFAIGKCPSLERKIVDRLLFYTKVRLKLKCRLIGAMLFTRKMYFLCIFHRIFLWTRVRKNISIVVRNVIIETTIPGNYFLIPGKTVWKIFDRWHFSLGPFLSKFRQPGLRWLSQMRFFTKFEKFPSRYKSTLKNAHYQTKNANIFAH